MTEVRVRIDDTGPRCGGIQSQCETAQLPHTIQGKLRLSQIPRCPVNTSMSFLPRTFNAFYGGKQFRVCSVVRQADKGDEKFHQGNVHTHGEY